MYMHIFGNGDATKLAQTIHEALGLTKTPAADSPTPAVRAAVRHRTGARYGIEFLTLSAEQRRQIVSATSDLPRYGDND